jgi:hypothetical protein
VTVDSIRIAAAWAFMLVAGLASWALVALAVRGVG